MVAKFYGILWVNWCIVLYKNLQKLYQMYHKLNIKVIIGLCNCLQAVWHQAIT